MLGLQLTINQGSHYELSKLQYLESGRQRCVLALPDADAQAQAAQKEKSGLFDLGMGCDRSALCAGYVGTMLLLPGHPLIAAHRLQIVR